MVGPVLKLTKHYSTILECIPGHWSIILFKKAKGGSVSEGPAMQAWRTEFNIQNQKNKARFNVTHL